MRSMFAVSGVLFVISIAYWLGADAIRVSSLAGQVGADGLPKLLGLALGGLSVLLALQTWVQKRRLKASPLVADGGEDDVLGDWRSHLRALGLIAIGVVYVIVLPWLGYAVSAAVMLAVVAAYAGLRSWISLAAFAFGGAVVFYLIFVQLLSIPLPAGFWPALFN